MHRAYVGVSYGKFDPSSPTFSYLLPVSVSVSLLGAGSTAVGFEAGSRDEDGKFVEKESTAPAKGFYKLVSGEAAGISNSGGIRAKGGIAEVAENLVDTVGDQADL